MVPVEEAAVWSGPFVYGIHGDGGAFSSVHLLQWAQKPRKPGQYGVIGRVTCLASAPAERGIRKGAVDVRVHFCRCRPCVVETWHPSKFLPVPMPCAHGQVLELLSEPDEAALAKYAAVPVATTVMTDGSAPAVAGMLVGANLPVESNKGKAGYIEPPTSVTGVVKEEPLPESDECSFIGKNAAPAVVGTEQVTELADGARLGSPHLAHAIARRAEEVRHPRAYIGVFEFVAFAALRKRDVLLQMKEGYHSVVESFAPFLIDSSWALTPFPLNAIVCTREGGGQWKPGVFGHAGHFIAGLPSPQAIPMDGESVQSHCMCLGLIPIFTVEDGDCGLDVMVMMDGQMRTPNARSALRLELNAHMRSIANDVRWQDVFVALQEHAGAPAATGKVTTGHGAPANAAKFEESQSRPADTSLPLPPLPPPAMSPKNLSHTPHAMGEGDVLSKALVWATGLKEPSHDLIHRVRESLTADQLVQVCELKRGTHDVVPKQLPDATAVSAVAELGKRVGAPAGQTWATLGSRMKARIADAEVFEAWATRKGLAVADKKFPRGTWKQFFADASRGDLDRRSKHRAKMRITRALKTKLKNIKPDFSSRRQDGRRRFRRYSERMRGFGAGRFHKASLVREELYEWFTDIKRSMKCRFPVRALMCQAQILTETYVVECIRGGRRADPPKITYEWLREWRQLYGVSLRKPNRRFFVPRPVLKERLEITWLNIMRVRKLATLALGYDLALYNADQSPFHMNESGSKNAGTLCIRGCGVVPLKEVHAATRSRWTVQTCVSSDFVAGQAIPPLELMFKAEGDALKKRLQTHIPEWAPWLTVVTSPKGSYQEHDVLEYIETTMHWRLQGNVPWRILLMDAYAPQMTDRVRRAAWHRKLIVSIHGGGATSVCQVNDTDLHQFLKKEYVDMETRELMEQCRMRGDICPCVRREDCVAWFSLLWFQEHYHTHAAGGFWRTGLANALDGSQDALICREAGMMWSELGMPAKRANATADVEEEFRAGRLHWSFAHVYRLIADHPKRGRRYDDLPTDEGSSTGSDGEDCDNGENDNDGVVPPLASSHAAPTVAGKADASGVLAPSVEGKSGDVGEQERCAWMNERREKLQVLEHVVTQLVAVGEDGVAATVNQAAQGEKRKIRQMEVAGPDIALAFNAEREQRHLDMLRRRHEIERGMARDKDLKGSIAELIREQDRLHEKRVRLERASTVVECMDSLKSWTAAEFGQGHGDGGTRRHARNRHDVLERLRRRAPPLPPDLANQWEFFVGNWDRFRLGGLRVRAAWGSQFLNIVNELLARMSAPSVEGNPFADWMRKELRKPSFPVAPLRV